MSLSDLFVKAYSSISSYYKLRKASSAQRIAWKWQRDAFLALRKLSRSIDRLQTVQKEAEVEATGLLSRYESVQERVRDETEKALSTMENARTVISQYNHTEEALNSELEILKDVTIPDLILQRELTRSQLGSDIAVLARHRPSADAEE